MLPQQYVIDAARLRAAARGSMCILMAPARSTRPLPAGSVALPSCWRRSIRPRYCIRKGWVHTVGAGAGRRRQVHCPRAARWRKMLGGGMRQVGLSGGACIYALENNVERLA